MSRASAFQRRPAFYELREVVLAEVLFGLAQRLEGHRRGHVQQTDVFADVAEGVVVHRRQGELGSRLIEADIVGPNRDAGSGIGEGVVADIGMVVVQAIEIDR